MMRQGAFSASFWEATNYTKWLDMLESRDALWRDLGKLENWVDRILKGKCKSSRWGRVMLCVSADCLESTFAKIAPDSHGGQQVKREQQGVVAEGGQLYVEL